MTIYPPNTLAPSDFVPIQAIIRIKFEPQAGFSRGKVLSVKISLPNGCDLRNRTEHEQLIGEKYLKRWGLVKDIAV